MPFSCHIPGKSKFDQARPPARPVFRVEPEYLLAVARIDHLDPSWCFTRPDTMLPLAQGSLGFMGANAKKSRGDRVETM